MAIVPDIASLDTGQDQTSTNITMDNFLKVLYDYFDQSNPIGTSLSGASKVDGESSFTGDNSPNFELVSNTNSSGSDPAFTITPKDTNENWHLNLAFDSGELATVYMDPDGSIDDATTSPPSTTDNTSVKSSEQNDYKTAGFGPHSKFYVIEFVDAITILHFENTDIGTQGIGDLFHAGKIVSPFLDSFGEGLAFGNGDGQGRISWWYRGGGAENRMQVDQDNWMNADESLGFSTEWIGTDIMANVSGCIGISSGSSADNREFGIPRYSFEVNRQRQPGEIIDGGDVSSGGGTSFIFTGSSGTNTYTSIHPWDRNVTPFFNQG